MHHTSIFAGCHVFALSKASLETADRRVAAIDTDFRDGMGGGAKHFLCFLHSYLQNIIRNIFACLLFKIPTKVFSGKVGVGGKQIQGKLTSVIGADIF